jgi:hypothetical protein
MLCRRRFVRTECSTSGRRVDCCIAVDDPLWAHAIIDFTLPAETLIIVQSHKIC